jgi:hypothetical protein
VPTLWNADDLKRKLNLLLIFRHSRNVKVYSGRGYQFFPSLRGELPAHGVRGGLPAAQDALAGARAYPLPPQTLPHGPVLSINPALHEPSWLVLLRPHGPRPAVRPARAQHLHADLV